MDESILTKRIVVIDDSYEMRELFRYLLELSGFRNFEIYNSAETFKMKEDLNTVDFLITDHLMDEMTGKELAGEIKEAGYKFPILILTAGEKLQDFSDVADFVATKPLQYEQIMEILKMGLGYWNDSQSENNEPAFH